MTATIEKLGRADLMVKVDGPHGTRPVVGIANCLDPSVPTKMRRYRVWDVAVAGLGPVADGIRRQPTLSALAEIAAKASARLAGARQPARRTKPAAEYRIDAL